MKLCTLALVIISAILFISSCDKPAKPNVNNSSPPATAVATATPDEFATARANFAKHCSVCHGDEGKGGLVKVDNVKLKVPNLTEGHALHHPDEKFVKQITNGGDGMPKFQDKLSPEEINSMVRFIRHELQGGKAGEMTHDMK